MFIINLISYKSSSPLSTPFLSDTTSGVLDLLDLLSLFSSFFSIASNLSEFSDKLSKLLESLSLKNNYLFQI